MENNPPHDFEQLISWRTGLQMRREDKEKWRMIINSRLSTLKLSSLGKYYQFLISDTVESKSEWRELLGILTTGESYFFRDKGQFSLLKNLILPELIERRQKDQTLRIWSAGCSTGEEPYSIAILLDEMRNPELGEKTSHSALRIPHLKDWDIRILGTDINEKAIQKAKQGMYSQWSFRMTDPDLRNRYFKRRYDAWEIDEKIRKMVKFQPGNLMEDKFPDSASGIYGMDIILCRNVFIYFNSVSVAVVLEKLIETLNDGGYLMTGHGELFGQSLGGLQAKMFPESVVYQKSSEPKKKEIPEKPEIHIPESKISFPETISTKPEITGIKKPKIEEPKIRIPEPKIEKDSAIRNLHSAIEKGDYAAVIENAKNIIRDEPNNFDAHCLLAEAYANSGMYDMAADACRKAIDIDKTALKPYFLLSHIAEAQDNADEAKGLLKKVIYLDPSFAPAYLELGAIYDRENDPARAKKMRMTAIELLRALPPETAIEPYKGVTARELLEYVKKMV